MNKNFKTFVSCLCMFLLFAQSHNALGYPDGERRVMTSSMVMGSAIGAVVGALLWGLTGAVVGAVVGAAIGTRIIIAEVHDQDLGHFYEAMR